MLRETRVVGAARLAFTDRFGGVSAPPYDDLNLGIHVGDDPVAVRTNRDRLAAAIGLQPADLAYMNQVHGAEVVEITGPRDDEAVPEADGLVTRQPGRALVVLVADCVPVVLADSQAGVVGVAHAGRRGLVAGVVPAVVAAMRDLGARRLAAVVGPAACGRCYEVPADLREDVARGVPASWSRTQSGTPALDLPAGVADQLRSAGVRVDRMPACSIEDRSSFSYRREGRTGRMAGVAWLSGTPEPMSQA